MVWIVKNFLSYALVVMSIVFLFQRCAIYSFSGVSLSSEVKSFSIQDFYSEVALGPPDLEQSFTDRLRDELLQKTSLTQVDIDGDIQFEGKITEFSYTSLAPSASSSEQIEAANVERLKITVEVDYTNPYEKKFAFKKKRFSQHADMPATASADAEEERLIKEIFDKLMQDIFNNSVANW